MLQLRIGADNKGRIGVGRHECWLNRLSYRDAYLDGTLDTRLGQL